MKLKTITFERATDVSKGWGKEVQITNNIVPDGEKFPAGYSGKLLVYNKVGAQSSMHYHTLKHETFYVIDGVINFKYFNPETANILERNLTVGDVVIIPPANPHQVTALTQATIIEFASSDYDWDNFRVGKGDSQK